MAPNPKHSGFTLIELLVAMAVLALVAVQVLSMFSSQQRTYLVQSRVVEAQEDARLVAEAMLADLRMAGFMVPKTAGVASVDGGNAAADTLCASDPSVVDEDRLEEAMDRFAGAAIGAALSASATSASIASAEMDIDGDGDVDFMVGSGIILAGGTASHCARITAISAGSITFTPATPLGFALLDGRAVPAVIYELVGTDLQRNGLVLASQVEDVQVEFGVDENGDGLLGVGEFPLDLLLGSNLSQIRQVRLSVLTRTAREDEALPGPGRQAVANRAPGGADNFRRRLGVVLAAPRNVL
jgi:prepilin-type N-terminal cleavage/methylation domain-containing protein